MGAVALPEEIRDMTVQRVYEAFLNSHAINSKRTAGEYKARVEEFFQLILNKSIAFVTIEDIQSIKNNMVQEKYVATLLERRNSANTVVTKLRSVKSFYDELLMNEIEVNPMALKVKLKPKAKHHEALTIDEYWGMLEFLKLEEDGLEKYLYAKTLFHTGNRKSATLQMKWKDSFVQKKDSVTGKDIWIITLTDKGDKDIEKPISDEFYEELQQLNHHGYENVFPVLSSSDGAYKRFERSIKKYGKTIGRNISIHTIKATAITVGYQLTKDINLAKQLGSHSSISTTEIYIKEEKAYTSQLSFNMSKKLDESVLDNLTHKELLQFINSNPDIKKMMVARLSL